MLFKMDTSIRQTPGDCLFSCHFSVINATKLFMKQSLLLRPTTGAGLNSSRLKKKFFVLQKVFISTDVVMIFHWVTLAVSVILLLFLFTTVVLGTGHYLCGGGGGGDFFCFSVKEKT